MARRHYSDEDRAAALAALRANGGNVRRTAGQVGVPASTLAGWAAGDHAPVGAELRAGKKLELADRFEEIARAALGRVTAAKLDEANAPQLLTAAGIAVDKMRLLREQPTEITAQLVLIEQILDNDDHPQDLLPPQAAAVSPE